VKDRARNKRRVAYQDSEIVRQSGVFFFTSLGLCSQRWWGNSYLWYDDNAMREQCWDYKGDLGNYKYSPAVTIWLSGCAKSEISIYNIIRSSQVDGLLADVALVT
jgi:hypothetical protein